MFVDFYEAFFGKGRGVYVEVFPPGILWYKCYTMVYCFSDLILESFCWVCIDGLEVIFSYEVLYLMS